MFQKLEEPRAAVIAVPRTAQIDVDLLICQIRDRFNVLPARRR